MSLGLWIVLKDSFSDIHGVDDNRMPYVNKTGNFHILSHFRRFSRIKKWTLSIYMVAHQIFLIGG